MSRKGRFERLKRSLEFIRRFRRSKQGDGEKIKVLISDPLSEKGLEILKKENFIEIVEKTKMTEDELCEEIKGKDAIIIRSGTKVTRKVIECADELKVIARAGVGLDNVDIEAATEKGIVVMNAPAGNTISTAEHTFALILSLARKIPWAYNSLQSGEWKRSKFKGVELFRKTLGIIGLGRIGTEVAKRAKAFGMTVIAYDPFTSEERASSLGIELVDLDEIYENSDFITVHVPLNENTKGMIGEREIKKMKDGVRIINAARGGIVDEEALAKALEEGKVAGAAVDVYSSEPPSEDNPLLKAPNCLTTPHLGASTSEAQENVAVETAEAIVDFFKNGIIRNSVNIPSIDVDSLENLRGFVELSERMGKIIAQLVEEPVEEVNIVYSGGVASEDTKILTRSFIKGFLEPSMGEGVNYVNAPVLLDSKGIKISETFEKVSSSEFSDLIKAIVKTDGREYELWGTVYNKYDPKIVRFGPYFFEVDPEGIMLIVQNRDKPGVVGAIGTILGKRGVNIASMKLAREKKGEKALMLFTIDSEISDDVKREILDLNDVIDLKVLKI